MKNLREKSFIQSVKKIIKEMEVLNNAGDDFVGTYIDRNAFNDTHILFENILETIKEYTKN